MDIQNTLKILSEIDGASGSEENINFAITDILKNYNVEIQSDKLLNIIAIKKADSDYTIMLDAHIDEICGIVTGITKEGFIRFTSIGGLNPQVLLAAEVTVHGKQKLYGVVATIPVHLQSDKDREKTAKIDELLIDTGLGFEKLTEAVNLGDRITLKSSFCKLRNSYASGKAFDDRAGVVVLLSVLDKLKDKNLPFNLAFLFSSQEEAGRRGAKVGAFSIEPNEAIAVDVTHAATPDANKNRTFESDSPAIGVSPLLSRDMSDTMIGIAKKEAIPYQVEVMGGDTGTNAHAIQIAKSGIKTALISLPLKYMHTQNEVIDLKAIDHSANLICSYLLRGAI